jgi:acyl-CoA thioester hydrolase
MADFHFYHPIEVRYGDLDPQGHVNNAKYLTYMEQARLAYVQRLGLWRGGSFMDIGIIVARATVAFHAPILLGQPVRVGVRVARLGHKSLVMEYRLEDGRAGQELADGSTILVAYDYHQQISIPIPPDWRQAIEAFEERDLAAQPGDHS